MIDWNIVFACLWAMIASWISGAAVGYCYANYRAMLKNCPHGVSWDDCPDCRH